MSNDLISRDALKEDFKSRLALCNEWIEKAKDKETKIRASAVKAFISEVIMTIDNAPTVERQQGEWELHGMIYYCSNCGHYCGESGDNFCGNCGADMRKGGAV